MLRKMFRPRPMISWEIVEKDVIDEIIFTTPKLRNRLMLELMARGGMRVGEVLKLRAMDVHDRKLTLRDPKSGKEREHVFIPQKVADRLKEYIRDNGIEPDQRIFPISYEAARTMVKKAGERVGIRLRPHDPQTACCHICEPLRCAHHSTYEELRMSTKRWLVVYALFLMGIFFSMSKAFCESDVGETKALQVYPIGKVVKKDSRTLIVIDKKFEAGLLRMDRLSSVMVICWFDRNDTPEKRSILQVHPRGNTNDPLTGVFATHSPVRPNLIGVSRCKIISIKGNIVEIDHIDAFDGSPVIDLKS